MPNTSERSPAESEDILGAEPSQVEIDAWAARERARRQAWLNGPTDTEKAVWAEREQSRRQGGSGTSGRGRSLSEPAWYVQKYMREMQLATEGAMSLLFKLSLSDAFGALVRAGRDWEDEFASSPPRRRRVALEAESSERSTSGRVPLSPEPPTKSS